MPFANRNLMGIAALTFGVMIFSLQDAILKSISHDYAVTFAIAARCVVALPILLVFVWADGGFRTLRSPIAGLLVLRGALLLVAYTTYYLALPALPLAEAVALFFFAPMLVTVMSAPVLGERVAPWSWAAVALGFIGVLMILQPGTSLFEPAALYSLVSAATYALAMVLARKYGVRESASVMAFYQSAVYFIGAILAAAIFSAVGFTHSDAPSIDFLVRPWKWPLPYDLFLMGLCGLIAAIAMWLLTQAYRMADANLVTVFEYSGMVWAPLWGLLFFREVPRSTTLIGLAMIFAAGIISAALAVRRSSRPSPAPSAST
jgi:drug/metabolite transporter (DMT)-like permease